MTEINIEKVVAYEGAHYQVGTAEISYVLRLGIRCEELANAYDVTGHNCALFITAFNPLGTHQSDEANLAAHQRLTTELQKMTPHILEGSGADPQGNWPAERSFLALGIDRITAELLGHQFQQDAVIWIGIDAVPELVLLR